MSTIECVWTGIGGEFDLLDLSIGDEATTVVIAGGCAHFESGVIFLEEGTQEFNIPRCHTLCVDEMGCFESHPNPLREAPTSLLPLWSTDDKGRPLDVRMIGSDGRKSPIRIDERRTKQ